MKEFVSQGESKGRGVIVMVDHVSSYRLLSLSNEFLSGKRKRDDYGTLSEIITGSLNAHLNGSG